MKDYDVIVELLILWRNKKRLDLYNSVSFYQTYQMGLLAIHVIGCGENYIKLFSSIMKGAIIL